MVANISETITDELMQKLYYGPDIVVAEINYGAGGGQQIRLCDVPVTEKLEKFVEDVKCVLRLARCVTLNVWTLQRLQERHLPADGVWGEAAPAAEVTGHFPRDGGVGEVGDAGAAGRGVPEDREHDVQHKAKGGQLWSAGKRAVERRLHFVRQ